MSSVALFVNEKGGVGKSTLADELFASLERTRTPVCLMNLDAQYSSTSRGCAPEDAALVIVDTPGTLPGNISDMVRASDVVVIPTRPTARCVEPFCRTVSLVRDADPNAHIVVMVVGISPRSKGASAFKAWLAGWLFDNGLTGPAFHVGYVPLSEAFGNAEATGTSVSELVSGSPRRFAIDILPSLSGFVNHVRVCCGIAEECPYPCQGEAH